MPHISVLSPFFAVVVNGVTELDRDGMLSELLYTDHLALMSETIEGLWNKSKKWKVSFESNGLKVNLGRTK